MCGVAGLVTLQPGDRDRFRIVDMTEALHHRGPDDCGYLAASFGGAPPHVTPDPARLQSVAPANVLFGHRRLSIIDLAGGRQPLANEDRSVWVTYNGEIYNYRELRAELQRAGHRFATATDTEVLVHGWEEWGIEMLTRLNGIFGFGLWDARLGRLLLARDPFGVKPLYWAEQPNGIAFASEVRALLAGGVVARLDHTALATFLQLRYVPAPATVFEGIRKLRPGHALQITVDGWRLQEIRYVASPADCRTWRRVEDCASELAAAFDAAIERQMVADVPVGVLLSGGVDSALVSARMAAHSQSMIEAYTVGFGEGGDANEIEDAANTASLIGARHHPIVLARTDYEEALPELVRIIEEPVVNTSALAMLAVSRRASQDVKVVLTGQGADEPFAGYRRYAAAKLVGSGLGRVAAVLMSIFGMWRRPAEDLLRLSRLAGPGTDGERICRAYTVFSASRLRFLLRHPVDGSAALKSLEPWRAELAGRPLLEQMLYLDTRTWLPDELLLVGDKTSMAVGLEARVPFLDVELMRLVERIPTHFRLAGLTRHKFVHKLAAAHYLPADIVHRPKRGFATPMEQWLGGPTSDWARRLLLGPEARTAELFQRRAVGGLLDAHRAGRQFRTRQIFALIVIELWTREFLH